MGLSFEVTYQSDLLGRVGPLGKAGHTLVSSFARGVNPGPCPARKRFRGQEYLLQLPATKRRRRLQAEMRPLFGWYYAKVERDGLLLAQYRQL